MSAINGILPGGCYRPDMISNPTNARTGMQGGKVMFENDNYKISANDDNNVIIHSKKTGEEYNIWGDPHVNIDGKHSFDFWGTTTFNLDDGTKVTIDTTPWKGDQNATVASKVTITNGDYGVQITGVDSNTKGDLKFNETKANGWLMDAMVDDGNTIYENPVGKGFVAIDDHGHIRNVDQKCINETDLLKGGALKDKYADAFKMLSSLMSISFFSGFMQGLVIGDDFVHVEEAGIDTVAADGGDVGIVFVAGKDGQHPGAQDVGKAWGVGTGVGQRTGFLPA